jgi:hypothetical protein
MPDIQISEALLQLSSFLRLENLNLHLISSGSHPNVHQIDVSLLMVSQNCIKLNILSLTFNHNQNKDLISGQLFKILGQFRRLEKLRVWYLKSILECGSVENFKSMFRLKFLRLFMWGLDYI